MVLGWRPFVYKWPPAPSTAARADRLSAAALHMFMALVSSCHISYSCGGRVCLRLSARARVWLRKGGFLARSSRYQPMPPLSCLLISTGRFSTEELCVYLIVGISSGPTLTASPWPIKRIVQTICSDLVLCSNFISQMYCI